MDTKLNEALTYNSHLTQEVEKLREEVNSRREGTCLSSNSESIEALKHQIQICTEDFEYERSDREKAQHRISQLEEEMRQIKAERDRYKTRISQLESESSKVGILEILQSFQCLYMYKGEFIFVSGTENELLSNTELMLSFQLFCNSFVRRKNSFWNKDFFMKISKRKKWLLVACLFLDWERSNNEGI